MTDRDTVLAETARYTDESLAGFGYVTRENLRCQELVGGLATARAYGPDGTFTGAVYDADGALLPSTLRFNERDIQPVDAPTIAAPDLVSLRRCEQDVALYGGILFPILGHFLLESLARLWPLLWPLRPGIPVYFHPWPGLDREALLANPLYGAIFAALGLRPRDVVVLERATWFGTLLVPEPASRYHLALDRRMGDLFDRVADGIAPGREHRPVHPDDERVYLSRSRWRDNPRVRNEAAIDALMAERGFRVVHTEMLAPRDLVTLLSRAGTIVSCDGSHAHLAVFCRPGTRAILLDTRPVPSQVAIGLLRGLRTRYVPLFSTRLIADGVVADLDVVGLTLDALLGEA